MEVQLFVRVFYGYFPGPCRRGGGWPYIVSVVLATVFLDKPNILFIGPQWLSGRGYKPHQGQRFSPVVGHRSGLWASTPREKNTGVFSCKVDIK